MVRWVPLLLPLIRGVVGNTFGTEGLGFRVLRETAAA